jgi:hypothetical protein
MPEIKIGVGWNNYIDAAGTPQQRAVEPPCQASARIICLIDNTELTALTKVSHRVLAGEHRIARFCTEHGWEAGA